MEIMQKYIVEIFVHTHSNPAAGANLVLWRLLIGSVEEYTSCSMQNI